MSSFSQSNPDNNYQALIDLEFDDSKLGQKGTSSSSSCRADGTKTAPSLSLSESIAVSIPLRGLPCHATIDDMAASQCIRSDDCLRWIRHKYASIPVTVTASASSTCGSSSQTAATVAATCGPSSSSTCGPSSPSTCGPSSSSSSSSCSTTKNACSIKNTSCTIPRQSAHSSATSLIPMVDEHFDRHMFHHDDHRDGRRSLSVRDAESQSQSQSAGSKSAAALLHHDQDHLLTPDTCTYPDAEEMLGDDMNNCCSFDSFSADKPPSPERMCDAWAKAEQLAEPLRFPLTIFGLTQDYWQGNMIGLRIQQFFVTLLAVWALIGWMIHTVYFFKDEPMPEISGWYEVSTNFTNSIPSALLMTTSALASYIHIVRHFKRFESYVITVIAETCLMHSVAACRIEHYAKKYTSWSLRWAVVFGILAEVNSLGIDIEYEDDFFDRSIVAIIFDAFMTIASFFMQFYIIAFAAGYLSILCRIHRIQLGFYVCYIRSETLHPTITNLTSVYKQITALVLSTCRRFEGYLSFVSASTGLALVAILVNGFIALTHEWLYFRIVFIVGYMTPIYFAMYEASAISDCMDDMVSVANALPPRDNPAESTYLCTFFATSSAKDSSGFRVFGYVIRSQFFFRVMYILGVIVSSLIQYKCSQ
jgi:hypothetical protein